MAKNASKERTINNTRKHKKNSKRNDIQKLQKKCSSDFQFEFKIPSLFLLNASKQEVQTERSLSFLLQITKKKCADVTGGLVDAN